MTTSISPHLGPVVDAVTAARAASQRLRNTLRLNATTSLVGGLVAFGAAGPIDRLLATGHSGWVRLVGAALSLFAIDVALVAGARTSVLRRATPAIIVGDCLWVGATVVTIVAGWYSTGGAIILGGVGLMVAGFAARQTTTLARLRRAPSADAINEHPPVEVAHVERRILAPADVVWDVITDHEFYGRVAPNLGSVQATGPDGPELTRSCSNRSGTAWSETCTLWEAGERFEIAVDTSHYPYPLAEMRGSWWVRAADTGGVVVGMDFRYRPRAGWRGRTFAALMQAGFPPVLRRILTAWEHEAVRRTGTTTA